MKNLKKNGLENLVFDESFVIREIGKRTGDIKDGPDLNL